MTYWGNPLSHAVAAEADLLCKWIAAKLMDFGKALVMFEQQHRNEKDWK